VNFWRRLPYLRVCRLTCDLTARCFVLFAAAARRLPEQRRNRRACERLTMRRPRERSGLYRWRTPNRLCGRLERRCRTFGIAIADGMRSQLRSAGRPPSAPSCGTPGARRTAPGSHRCRGMNALSSSPTLCSVHGHAERATLRGPPAGDLDQLRCQAAWALRLHGGRRTRLAVNTA
jgi:hypothetical protein